MPMNKLAISILEKSPQFKVVLQIILKWLSPYIECLGLFLKRKFSAKRTLASLILENILLPFKHCQIKPCNVNLHLYDLNPYKNLVSSLLFVLFLSTKKKQNLDLHERILFAYNFKD